MLVGWSLAAPEYKPQMKYAITAVTGHKQMWSASVIAVTCSIYIGVSTTAAVRGVSKTTIHTLGR